MKNQTGYCSSTENKIGRSGAGCGAQYLARSPLVSQSRTDENVRQKYNVQSLTRARYLETFKVLQGLSREYQDITEFVALEMSDTVKTSFSLLDIGAGSGYLLENLVERSVCRHLSKYVAVEPDPVAAASLIQMLNGYDQISSMVMIERYCQALAADLEQKFDVVIFCHSLYGVRDPIEALNGARKLLAKNGVLIAIVQSPMGVANLFADFDVSLNRDKPSLENFKLNGQKVADGLRSVGSDFSLFSVSSFFDVSSLFDGSAESDARRLEFLSFLLQCELADAPRQLVADADRRLRSLCVTKDGKVILPQATDAFVIR